MNKKIKTNIKLLLVFLLSCFSTVLIVSTISLSNDKYILKDVITDANTINRIIESKGSKIRLAEVKELEDEILYSKFGITYPLFKTIRDIQDYPQLDYDYLIIGDTLYIQKMNKEFVEGTLEIYVDSLINDYYGEYTLKTDPATHIVSSDVMKEKQKESIEQYYKVYLDLLQIRLEMYEGFLEKDLEYLNNGNPYFQPLVDENRKEIKDINDAIITLEKERDLEIQLTYDSFSPVGLTIQNDIYILDNGENVPSDIVPTMIHEYLHYSSADKTLYIHPFFEEGLTDIFATYITNKEELFNYTYQNSYPYNSKLIYEIIDDIGFEQLEKIYFEKDEERLFILLEEYYEIDFETDYYESIYEITYTDTPSVESVDLYEEFLGRIINKE